jgi:signal transduction histidine kinase
MKSGVWAVLTLLSILAVFIIQTYVVYDNYQTSKNFLLNDINDVLSETFKKDLHRRQGIRRIGEGITVVPPPPDSTNTTVFNVDSMKLGADKTGTISNKDFISTINTVVNIVVSKDVPISLQPFDSIANTILLSKGIHTDICTQIVDLNADSVIQSSDTTLKPNFMSIRSKYLPLDFQQTKALQLTLTNPLSEILGRMFMVLVSSLILSLLGFWGLYLIYANLKKQKRIVELKNTFFSHAAHELRRPVNTLSFALEQIKRPEIRNNEEKLNKYIDITGNITSDMDARITMILTLAKAEEGVLKLYPEKYNFNDQIAEIIQYFKKTTPPGELEISFDTAQDITQILADKELCKLVLMNLIENSIKYTVHKPARIQLSLSSDEQGLNLIVADNGRGIPPEKINLIFDKYRRLNPEDESRKGFGIGLNFVKTIIDAHRGSIQVSSVPGSGSEFKLVMPC